MSVHGQERPVPATEPPARLRRVGNRTTTWGLSRALSGFRAVTPADRQIGGTAPKWILQDTEANKTLIAKLGAKNGRVEVLTELFNALLGKAIGYRMAECGLARLDENLYFVSRYFLAESERLVHGSLMIEDVMNAPNETERVPRRMAAEQAFYSLDFVREVFERFCGTAAHSAFDGFVQMLVFDALIGSQDRHAQNWGVIAPATGTGKAIRFAPIFDSAHTLLWDYSSAKLRAVNWCDAALRQYVWRARPCIGPPNPLPASRGHCNHFELVAHLLDHWPAETAGAIQKLGHNVRGVARELLERFPFNRCFCVRRKQLIAKILDVRHAEILRVYQRKEVTQ